MGLEQVRAGGAPFTEELLRSIAKRMSEAKILCVGVCGCVCLVFVCGFLCLCDMCL